MVWCAMLPWLFLLTRQATKAPLRCSVASVIVILAFDEDLAFSLPLMVRTRVRMVVRSTRTRTRWHTATLLF
jgi:hypothetical protein